MWLIRNTGKKVAAHIWMGNDTVCRMWSTGGLKQSRFSVRGTRGSHEICTMCLFKLARERGITPERLASYREAHGYEWSGF